MTAGHQPGAPDLTGLPDQPGEVIKLGNEFAEVVVELIRTRNGSRLRIFVPSSGAEISLCPLELEALTWQDHDFFSRLLATPHGPESAAEPGPVGGAESGSQPWPPERGG